MNFNILLLQARRVDDRARHEERISFAQQSGLAVKNIVPYDLLSSVPALSEVRRYDALMIGGSGDYYVSKEDLPDFPGVLALLADLVETGQPMFASCFGFQLLVVALGGEVGYDPNHMEVGTYGLTLTQDGGRDELFSTLPTQFRAQLGHKDRAIRLPQGAINLAYSENAPYQALRIPGKPIWATQFHPELTGAENRRRFHRYLDGYAAFMSPEELQETLDRFDDSPETDKLLPRFLKTVFG